MASYSVLIKWGMVLRGGNLERLDIGVKDDRILAVGDLSREKAPVEIDATGRYVSPGFIDLTSHSDTHWTLFDHPSQESFLRQGVTTILGGNCGSSLAPLVKASDIAGTLRWTDASRSNVNWRSLDEFFSELSRRPIGVNFATLVGHGTLRRGVMGETARNATPDEIGQMRFLLEKSFGAGAFGFSTSLASTEGLWAGPSELSSLFALAGSYGVLTKHHLKDEGKNILPAVVSLIQLAREAGAKMHLSHFKILGRASWPLFHDVMRVIESGREEGLDLTLDAFPYTRTGSLLQAFLPPWLLEGGREKILAALGVPARREEVKSYLKSLTLHYDRITVASVLRDFSLLGKTLSQLAAAAGLEPEETMLRLLEVNDLKVAIFNEVISAGHLEELIRKEYCLVASDGVGYAGGLSALPDLPHPRSFGAFPRAFELFVKEKNILSFPELIRKMTELPAAVLGLKDRGKIEKGFFADVVIFNPETISSPADYENPQLGPGGVEWVLVNGRVSVSSGNFNGNLAGRILKRE